MEDGYGDSIRRIRKMTKPVTPLWIMSPYGKSLPVLSHRKMTQCHLTTENSRVERVPLREALPLVKPDVQISPADGGTFL